MLCKSKVSIKEYLIIKHQANSIKNYVIKLSYFFNWTVTSFSADRVTLTLGHLDLSTWAIRDNCSSFHLEVRDGTDEDAPLIGRYCSRSQFTNDIWWQQNQKAGPFYIILNPFLIVKWSSFLVELPLKNACWYLYRSVPPAITSQVSSLLLLLLLLC